MAEKLRRRFLISKCDAAIWRVAAAAAVGRSQRWQDRHVQQSARVGAISGRWRPARPSGAAISMHSLSAASACPAIAGSQPAMLQPAAAVLQLPWLQPRPVEALQRAAIDRVSKCVRTTFSS